MDKLVKRDCIDPLREPGKPIIVVAAVREAEAIAYACRDIGISVTAFCDTEVRKTAEPLCGLEVIHTPTLQDRYPEARFILASQQVHDVAEQLSEMGYEEMYSALELFENFDIGKHDYLISREYMETRISVYNKTHEAYFDDDKTYMRSLDIMVTTKCSLKCENCSNLMQYYKNPSNFGEKGILDALDVINQHVQDISEFRIIGGEPLMNRDWAGIVGGIQHQNPGRGIFIYTNGTIAPKEDLLKSFDRENVTFIITDYGKLSTNADRLVERLSNLGIDHVRTPAQNWLDCSRIHHHKRSPADLEEVFRQCCVKYVYTLQEGKLYRCPFIANAANLKAIPDNPADYVDLFSDKDDIKRQIDRLVKTRSFFPACDFCDGRPYDPSGKLGYDGKGMIEPGIQAPEPIPYQEYS